MKLEKIIDNIGKSLDRHLIIKRVCILEETFKAYKTYRILLYERVCGKITECLEYSKTDRILESNKDSIIENIEYEFLLKVLNYVYKNQ